MTSSPISEETLRRLMSNEGDSQRDLSNQRFELEAYMVENGWSHIWYANPFSEGEPDWREKCKGHYEDRWHVGVWSGPDNDIICVMPAKHKYLAEWFSSSGSESVLASCRVNAKKNRIIQSCVFCGGCQHLSVTEGEEDSGHAEMGGKLPHRCKKLNKVVSHKGRHPHIIRHNDCPFLIDSEFVKVKTLVSLLNEGF